ncbi:MAG: lysophospholipid acyltransferase family protein [Lysobacterales bacterium]|jgi:1-acyl-sn-glycerol-3-phosphate acyltransferase
MLSSPVSILRFIVRFVVLIGFLVFVLPVVVFLMNRNRQLGTGKGTKKADAVSVWLARRLAWLFGIRVEIRGEPVEPPVLFAANHMSWLDIPVLHSGCAMGFVGKAEIEQWPVFSHIARAGGTIFHQRGNHDSAAGVTMAMAERLREGRAVAIFPEGGIKPGAGMRVFHARMFKPAVEVGCRVQPVMLRYMHNGERDDDFQFRVGETMLQNFLRVLARRRVTAEVHFLPAIEAAGKPRRELAEAARAVVGEHFEREVA